AARTRGVLDHGARGANVVNPNGSRGCGTDRRDGHQARTAVANVDPAFRDSLRKAASWTRDTSSRSVRTEPATLTVTFWTGPPPTTVGRAAPAAPGEVGRVGSTAEDASDSAADFTSPVLDAMPSANMAPRVRPRSSGEPSAADSGPVSAGECGRNAATAATRPATTPVRGPTMKPRPAIRPTTSARPAFWPSSPNRLVSHS